MAKSKHLLSAYAVLMLVIVLAAVATWLIPAGAYHRLSYAGSSSFVYTAGSAEQALPFTQHTLAAGWCCHHRLVRHRLLLSAPAQI